MRDVLMHLSEVRERLSRQSRVLLLVDFDGTLCPLYAFAVWGCVTATIATFFLGRGKPEGTRSPREAGVAELIVEVGKLRDEIREQRGSRGPLERAALLRRKGRLELYWNYLRSSLWFIPVLIIAAAIGLALGLIDLQARFEFELAAKWPRLFAAEPRGVSNPSRSLPVGNVPPTSSAKRRRMRTTASWSLDFTGGSRCSRL